MPDTLQLEHGIRMNVFEAPGRNTSSEAIFIAREMSLEFVLLVLIWSKWCRILWLSVKILLLYTMLWAFSNGAGPPNATTAYLNLEFEILSINSLSMKATSILCINYLVSDSPTSPKDFSNAAKIFGIFLFTGKLWLQEVASTMNTTSVVFGTSWSFMSKILPSET